MDSILRVFGLSCVPSQCSLCCLPRLSLALDPREQCRYCKMTLDLEQSPPCEDTSKPTQYVQALDSRSCSPMTGNVYADDVLNARRIPEVGCVCGTCRLLHRRQSDSKNVACVNEDLARTKLH